MSLGFEPELRLLCALLATEPGASPFAHHPSQSDQHFRWSMFEELVARHRVSALVDAQISQMPDLAVPSDLRARLAAAPIRNLSFLSRSIRCAREIVEACEREEIACVILKGFAVAQSAYDQAAKREMIDVDLLVERARFDQVEAMVLAMGFVRIGPSSELAGNARSSFMAMHNAFTFIRRSDGMQIDLHWQLVNNPRLLPKLNLSWQKHLTRMDVAGSSLPVLDPVPHALYILVHGVKSGWVRLKWLADADRIIRRLDPGQLQELIILAGEEQLDRLVATSLLLTKAVLGTPLNPAIQSYADTHADRSVLALQLRLISAPLPAKRKRLSDARQLALRIEHSLRLHCAPGYKRAALLREIANLEDLALVRVPPGWIWVLGLASPALALARLMRLPFATDRS